MTRSDAYGRLRSRDLTAFNMDFLGCGPGVAHLENMQQPEVLWPHRGERIPNRSRTCVEDNDFRAEDSGKVETEPDAMIDVEDQDIACRSPYTITITFAGNDRVKAVSSSKDEPICL